MNLLLATLLAGPAGAVRPPRPPAPVAAEAIPCARPVEFRTPYPWRYGADAAPLSTGTALVVEADEGLLRPRNIGQRVLWVEGGPAEILARAGGKALVLTGAAVGPQGARAWFADDTLPERVDAALASRLGAAAAAAMAPLPVAGWGEPLHVDGRNDLLARWPDWADTCPGAAAE